jgi:di/tricarboxylate transporter
VTVDAWITLAVLAIALGLLIWDRFVPSVIVFGATVTLLLANVIDTGQAFSGFSNPAPITVGALYVVAAAAQRTGLLSALVASALGRTGGLGSLTRLVIPSALSSGVFNNTPLVAILIPDVVAWCRRLGISASRFLLPLSYAAILGGTLTVLGTSTNLVVSGLLEESGAEPLGVFELTKVGAPVVFVGLVTLIFVSSRLVPERQTAPESVAEDIREFAMEMRVLDGSSIDGQTVEEAGLRHLSGVYLVQIDRRGQVIAPVAPTETLEAGDALTFVGAVDNVLDLQRMRGLAPAGADRLDELRRARNKLFEVVVGRSSPVAGRTLRESDFRARYGAAVLAIHRSGQRITTKLGDVRLRHGDTLVLLAGPDFRARWTESGDFLVTAPLNAPPPAASRQAPIVAAVLVAFIVLSAVGVLSIVEGALLAAGAVIALRVVSFSDAKKSIDLDVLLLIASAFGLGVAVETSGLAQNIADGFVDSLGGLGTFGVILGVVLATWALTEMVTNNAAAVVVFPIALSIAEPSGIDPRLMAIAVAITASTSFLSPIGYQTNTMVYGPGGYRFTDYVRAGLPLTIVTLLTIAGMTTLLN